MVYFAVESAVYPTYSAATLQDFWTDLHKGIDEHLDEE